MKDSVRERMERELESIREADGGVLRPVAVVRFAAENPDSALHGKFEWDDSRAAHAHRIWQARCVIETVCTVVRGDRATVRAYVSLAEERSRGGGYRRTEEMLSEPESRMKLLRQARAEMETFRMRYQELVELSEVFDAMKKAKSA